MLTDIGLIFNIDETHIGVEIIGKLTLNINGQQPYVANSIGGCNLVLTVGSNGTRSVVFPAQLIMHGSRQRNIDVSIVLIIN